jgi:thiosulfate/3-mercaptopyruvate sulfurtransferase
VTANSLIFAAHLLGNDRNRLYDGSWTDWGSDPETPKALGPAD